MPKKKKNWKKTGKSRKVNRKFEIRSHGSSDMAPEKEIEVVYDYIRKNPGKMKSQILKKSASFGMTRKRLMQRWDTIRDYLRDVGDNHLNRRNPDGEPWIIGIGTKKMKYYATDGDLDFVPAKPKVVELEYSYPSPTFSKVESAFHARAVPVIDEPPAFSETVESLIEATTPKTVDLVTIRYRGCVIRIPAGSDITLD